MAQIASLEMLCFKERHDLISQPFSEHVCPIKVPERDIYQRLNGPFIGLRAYGF